MLYFRIISFVILVSTATACKNAFEIGTIEEEGELVVLTRYSPTTYMIDQYDAKVGFEYELVRAFAEDMGHQLRFIIKDSTQAVIEDLALGKAHMAAAGLTVTEERSSSFHFSTSYQKVKQKVVCGVPKKVSHVNDLKKLNLIVVKGTSYEESLAELKAKHHGLEFITHQLSSESTLEMIWNKRDFCTIIDSHLLNIHRRYFPELRVVYEFAEMNELAWMFNSTDESLKSDVNKWLNNKGKKKTNYLLHKYYGHTRDFDYYDIKKFNQRVLTRLPKYKDYFQVAAKETGLPWTFLAAVAYQESQWNPKAVSPTGVRGIMMLTQSTAREVGVTKRTDPEQSIMGGARYLLKQIERLPKFINPSDRMWFALASYNVGYYHLRDAMALAILENKNPRQWVQVRTVLPLLSRRKYYKHLRYGHARGLEPVIYVTRIRNYYELLLNHIKNTNMIEKK